MGLHRPQLATWRRWCLGTALCVCMAEVAVAIVQKSVLSRREADELIFPEPAIVREQVKFWNAVFLRFPGTTTLIHDAFHPTLIIDLIDHQDFAKKLGKSHLSSRREREKLTKQYLQRYQLGIDRFAKHQSAAAKLGAIEERLYNVYRKNPEALRNLYLGRVNLRSQAGLADEFQRAAKRAALYLPHMERIFSEQGLPIDLTRLAFVESMFNLRALSKVGASGIWQFMPETARKFMRVDPYIDERSNPLKATRGASLLLQENYRNLGSWPLAITAYNHGTSSLQKAVKTLKTTDFETIVKSYEAPSFGFASRNFYGEFLAARNIYDTLFKRHYTRQDAMPVASIRLSRPVSISYLLSQTPLTRDTLMSHNRCLQPKAMARYYNEPLPKNFELIVPQYLAHTITVAVNNAQNKRARL